MPDPVPVVATKVIDSRPMSSDVGYISGGTPTSKYDKGSTISRLPDLNAVRSETQPWYDQMANMGVQVASTVVGQTISAFSSFADGAYNLVAKNDIKPDAGLSGVGQDMVNWSANEYPIYWDPNGSGLTNNLSYIASRIPSVASTLSMLIPGEGAAALFGGIGRALRMGSNIEKIMAIGGGAIAMRHAENWMESGQVYSDSMQKLISGDNSKNKIYTEEEADKISKSASTLNYKMNWANLGFDVLQMALMLKPASSFFTKTLRGGNSKLANVLDYGYNVSAERGLLEGANKFSKGLLRGVDIVKPFASQLSEGVEEVVNQVSQYEGQRKSDIDAGLTKDDGSSLWNRITGDYLKRWDTKDAFVWGTVGGAAFHLIGSSISNKEAGPTGWWNTITEKAELIASLKEREHVVAEYKKVLEDPTSTKYDKKVAQHNVVFNLVQNNRQSDSLDMLMQDMKNPQMMDKLASSLGENAKEFKENIPQMLEDMKWINETIDDYEGGSWNAMIGKRKGDTTDTAIDINETKDDKLANNTTSITARFNPKKEAFADPRLAQQLAYNDYSIKVKDRINKELMTDLNSVSNDLYGNQNLSPNAQQYLNLDSDLQALDSTKKLFLNKQAESKELDLSGITMENHKAVLKEIDRLIDDKTKQQDTLKEVIEANNKDEAITTETPLEKILELRDAQLPVSRIVAKKIQYYANQGDKQGIMDINKQILADPKKYELNMIEDMRKMRSFEEIKNAERKQRLADIKEVNEAKDALMTSDEYREKHSAEKANIAKELEGRDADGKNNYINSELKYIEDQIAELDKKGAFKADNMQEFEKSFNKAKYVELKARQEALRELLPKSEKVTESTRSGQNIKASEYAKAKQGTAARTFYEFNRDLIDFKEVIDALDAERVLANLRDLENVQKVAEGLIMKFGQAGSDTEKAVILDELWKALEPFNEDLEIEYNPKSSIELNQQILTVSAMRNLQGTIDNVKDDISALSEPIDNNSYLAEQDLFNYGSTELNGKVLKTSSRGIEQHGFENFLISDVASKYGTLGDMIKNQQDAYEILENENDRLKALADVEMGNKPPSVSSKTGVGPKVTEQVIDMALDNTSEKADPKIVATNREVPFIDRQRSIRERAMSSNEQGTKLTTPFKIVGITDPVTGKLKDKPAVDSLGRREVNTNYPFWPAHHIAPDGKVGPGFVRAGDVVTLRNDYEKGIGGTRYQVIKIFKDGIHVSNMDTSERLTKVSSAARVKLDAAKKEAPSESRDKKIKKIEDNLENFKELIEFHKAVEKKMAAAKGPMQITVKHKVVESDSTTVSGGVYFGDVYTTVAFTSEGKEFTRPINISQAFGDKVNQPGEAMLTTFYGDQFFVDNNGDMVDIEEKYPNIVVPVSMRRQFQLGGDKTLNSQIFSLVPTHTLDLNGKHIYMPIRLRTNKMNEFLHNKEGKEGMEGGTTLGESMFETILNPDASISEFEAIVKSSNLFALYQPGKLINEQTREFINAFFNTENLLDVFNKVFFVYDGSSKNKSLNKSGDYSKHLGLDVFVSKGAIKTEAEQEEYDKRKAAGTLTTKEKNAGIYLRMDLSNDVNSKNTYAIRLFDDTGKYAPVVGMTNKAVGVLDRSRMEEITPSGLPAGYQKAEVDVMQYIKKRINQKAFRIDKHLISKPTTSSKYGGLAFDRSTGKIAYKEYKSYVDYVAQNQLLDSTVFGLRTKSLDGKQEGTSYFENRALWFENNLSEVVKAPKATTAGKKKKLSKKAQAIASGKIVVTPGVLTINVHPAIAESIRLNNEGKVTKAKNGKSYNIDGETYERVSDVLGSTYPSTGASKTLATATGDKVDAMGKDFFDGNPTNAAMYNMSESAYQNTLAFFQDIKKNFVNGETAIGAGVTLYHTFPDGRKIAGEADLITQDLSGKMRIYDFKTSSDVFTDSALDKESTGNGITRSKRQQFLMQTSTYDILLEGMTGVSAYDLIILPMTVGSDNNSGTLSINTLVPAKILHFGDQRADLSDRIPALADNSLIETAVVENSSPSFIPEDEDGEIGTEEFEDSSAAADSVMPSIADFEPKNMSQALRLMYRDPANMRDYAHDMAFQNAAEEFVGDTITKIMYQQRNVDNNFAAISPTDLKKKVLKRLNDLIVYMKAPVVSTKGVVRTKSPGEMYVDSQKAADIQEVINHFDYRDMTDEVKAASQDFVGYFTMASMNVNASKIVKIDVGIQDDNEYSNEENEEDKALGYATRFVDNYAFKINPAGSVTVETKILLTQMDLLERRQRADGGFDFTKVYNRFGTAKKFPLSTTMNDLHIDFEDITPESLFEKLDAIADRSPIVQSLYGAIKIFAKDKDSKVSEEKTTFFKNKLSSLVLQHRKMLFFKATLEDGKNEITIGDAARQGISENILNHWEGNLKAQFPKLFEVTESKDADGKNITDIQPRKQNIQFAKKDDKTPITNFELPEDYDVDNFSTGRMYNLLLTQMTAAFGKQGPVRFNIAFDKNSALVLDGVKTNIGSEDFFHILSSFDMSRVILPAKVKGDVEATGVFKRVVNDEVVDNTVLDQISKSLEYFLSRRGDVEGEGKKSFGGYSVPVYKFMSLQLEKLGIQLAEDKSMSYLMLQDLNSPISENNSKMKYNLLDKKVSDFSTFLLHIIKDQTINPLKSENAFGVNKVQVDELSGEESTGRIDVDRPLQKAREGVTKLAGFVRSEWTSFANDAIRNVNGDMEFTYNPHNTLSLIMNMIKDTTSGYIEELANTPAGKHNVFIQQLADPNNVQARNEFVMKYVDGGTINKLRKATPENITQGTELLLGWAAYFNNEGKQTSRNRGYYLTTHGDSNVMPAFSFEKNNIKLDFEENIDADGVLQYRLKLQPIIDGESNPTYDKIYGILRGELERVAETYRIYKDIVSKDPSEQLKYANDMGYRQNTHYKIDENNNIVGPGTGTNFYLGGSSMFTGGSTKAGIDESKASALYEDNRSGLNRKLVDEDGNIKTEEKAQELLDPIIQDLVNELVDDAYKGMLDREGTFFTVSERGGTPQYLERKIKHPYLNSASTKSFVKRFDNNTTIVRMVDGERTESPVATIKSEIIKVPGPTWLEAKGNLPEIVATVRGEAAANQMALEDGFDDLTIPEKAQLREAFVAIKKQEQDEQRKVAQRPFAQMKYMIADRTLNEFIFRANLLQLTADPAITVKDKNYMAFHYDFVKRQSVMFAPGTVSAATHPAYVVGFKDHMLGSITKEYTQSEMDKMSPEHRHFLEEFKKYNPSMVVNNRIPVRAISYAAFYYALDTQQLRETFVKEVVGKKLSTVEVTDAGSYHTAREFLYRLNKTGKITDQDYRDGIEAFYFQRKVPAETLKRLEAIVVKYVYAGFNVVQHDDNVVTAMTDYIKNAEMPLIKGFTVHEDTPLYSVANTLEKIEQRQMNGKGMLDILPGIIAVPPSAYKLGFTSTASLYDEDGNHTEELFDAPVQELNRSFLRQQIDSNKKDKEKATISNQSIKFKGLDLPSYWRVGRSGTVTFAQNKEMLEGMSEDELNELSTFIENQRYSSDGLSGNQIEKATFDIYRQVALLKMAKLATTNGFKFNRNDLDYSITDTEKFIENVIQHSVDQHGMNSNSVSSLAIDENKELALPISFVPNNKRFQSVIIAELEKVFTKFSLPGGAFAQVSARGLTKNADLKSYDVEFTTKTFADQAAVNARLNKEEIESSVTNKDGSVTVKYKTFVPGEAMLVWNFRDEKGKLLPYEKYLDDKGNIKMINGKPSIDPALLEIIVNRIPNTGLNTMSKLNVVKFFPAHIRDAIAMAPEIVDVYNADFDYDKLYTYVYNHEFDADGRLVKINGVLHPSQNGIGNSLNSNLSERAYASSELMAHNKEYASLASKIEEIENRRSELAEIVESGNGSIRNLESIPKMEDQDEEAYITQMKTLETEFMQSEEFKKVFDSADIYAKQNEKQLQNALLNGYHAVLGDFKSMRASTNFLTADWLHDQIERKINVPESQNGETVMVPKTIAQLFEEREYYNVASWWTNSKMRVANSDGGKSVGISANILTSLYNAQRFGLSYNSKHRKLSDSKENLALLKRQESSRDDYDLKDLNIDPESIVAAGLNPEYFYSILFSDNKGNVKSEQDRDNEDGYNSFSEDNKTYRHLGNANNAYTAVTYANRNEIYRYPAHGRYRYDRIYTINNKGERVNISSVVQGMLQAFLDFKNNPVKGYQNINSKTSNALMAMMFQGYVDEAPLVLMQESVKKYVNAISNSETASEDERVYFLGEQLRVIADIMGKDHSTLQNEFKTLSKAAGTDNIHFFINDMIRKELGGDMQFTDVALNEDTLVSMIPVGLGIMGDKTSQDYRLGQLKAFRNYLLADSYGKDLFKFQQYTNSDAKGAPNTIVGIAIKNKNYNNLFSIKDGQLESSVPTLAGVHRLDMRWANQMLLNPNSEFKAKARYQPSLSSFAQNYGIRPIYNLLAASERAGIFLELSPLYTAMKNSFMATVGIEEKGLSTSENERLTNKLNVNFVSYMFSREELYRGFFPAGPTGDAEFKFFKEKGKRALSIPDSKLGFDESYSIFDTAESAAATLNNLKNMKYRDARGREVPYRNEYEIINALTAQLNTTKKSVSSMNLSTSSKYQEGLSMKLVTSLAAMAASNDPILISAAKKFILYAFMNGGVTSPSSFIQHVPFNLFTKLGISQGMKAMIEDMTNYDTVSGKQVVTKKTAKEIKSFVVQFIQHNRFEMKRFVDSKNLETFPANPDVKDSAPSKMAYNEKIGRMMIKFSTDSKLNKNTMIVKYDERLWMRSRAGSRMFQEIDYAGYSRFNKNEYKFNSSNRPVVSIYPVNNSEKSKNLVEGILEMNGEMNVESDGFSADEDADYIKLYNSQDVPLVTKISNYIKLGTVDATEMITDMQLQDFSINGSVFRVMKEIASNSNAVVKFVNDPSSNIRQFTKGDTITINYGHARYAYADDFNLQLFSDDFAHELGHLGTIKALDLYYEDAEKLKDSNPELHESIEQFVKLHSLVEKQLLQNKGLKGDFDNYHKYKTIIEALDRGKSITQEEKVFTEDHSYFRSFTDIAANKKLNKNVEAGTMKEFAAYAFGNADFQNLLNRISFKEGAKQTTFWQKVKEALADLLQFFGFGNQEQTDKEIGYIKKQFTPVSRRIVLKSGSLENKYTKQELPASIKNLEGYSALHVALKNLIEIKQSIEDSMEDEARNSIAADAAQKGASAAADVYSVNNIPGIDRMYEGIKNYDPAWNDEIKLLYHEATGNGAIIC